MTKTLKLGRSSALGLGTSLGKIAAAVALLCLAASGQALTLKDSYADNEVMEFIPGTLPDAAGSVPVIGAGTSLALGFEGPSQYNAASFGRNFIPPDTIGAVGRTQYMATTNGAYGIYDKSTGALLSMTSDVAFWAAAGQTGANGDSRIIYNPASSRWVVVSFGASVADLQIAVSNTDNALGGWKSVKFTGFAGGTADYPTLALDKNAVYIGTNNFKTAPGCNPSISFCGTTLNVIPLDSLFNAGAPTVANMKQFVTPFSQITGGADRGFAIQGVMGNPLTGTGKIVANSLFDPDNLAYTVTGLTSTSATAAALTPTTLLGVTALVDAGPARQPAAIAANRRVIDALDQRISSSVYESLGKLFSVQTVNGGSDFARVRYTVLDAGDFHILDQGDIGTGAFDYFQGSIAVNASGQAVIGYNRSGATAADLNGDGLADGNVSFMAQTFYVDAAGKLHSTSGDMLLKAGLTSDYHNGSVFGSPAAGRQRWGDYSQVSIDPNDGHVFWAIGEFAREYNNAAGGHPGGTGGSRWGTFIEEILVPAPEPSSLALLGLGLAAVAGLSKKRKALLG